MDILYFKYIIWITSDWFYIVYDNILILVCAIEADQRMGSNEPELVRLEQNDFCKDSKIVRKKEI